MKNIMVFMAVLITLAIFGLIGADDRKTQLMQAVVTHCEAQAADCSHLIAQVQADGHHEVIEDGSGRVWVEEK